MTSSAHWPMRRQLSRAPGYTLVELLVVLAIIGTLTLIAYPLAEISVQRDREQELRRALWQLRDAIDAYHRAVEDGQLPKSLNGSGYPPSLETLVNGLPNAKVPGRTMYFLRSIPRDPFASAQLAPAATWALRSYQSPADRPSPGEDVYDVHSRSDRIGLNGIALKQW